jgi:hypothetical protein
MEIKSFPQWNQKWLGARAILCVVGGATAPECEAGEAPLVSIDTPLAAKSSLLAVAYLYRARLS